MEKLMSNRPISRLALPSIIVLSLFCAGVGIAFAAISFPAQQFNATLQGSGGDTVFINWTNNYNPIITIGANATTLGTSAFSNVTIQVLNSTSNIQLAPNYSQPGAGTAFASVCSNLPLGNITLFNGTTGNIAPPLGGGNVTNFTVNFQIATLGSCMPGRYFGSPLTLRNSTVTTENLNLSVMLDIPITTNNTLNNNTGIATFNGTIPAGGPFYQSFYFFGGNASGFTNATSALINVSGWSSGQDVDIFLLDNTSTSTLASSISKNSTSEQLFFNYLDPTRTYEIRVYGNSTSAISYNGFLIMTSLEALNLTNNNKIPLLDFGTVNSTNVTTLNYQILNNGSVAQNNLTESKQLFYVKRFSGTGAQNFTFLVPDSSVTSSVLARLTWASGTASNYTLTVTDHRGNLSLPAVSNRGLLANFTNVTREEFVNVTGVPSTPGVWTVQVTNNTGSSDPFQLTVQMNVNASQWFATNFTSVNLNATNATTGTNSSQNVQINLTVPNNTLDGPYEGNITYTSLAGGSFRIPVRINVTTPILVVNNTMSLQTVSAPQNPGDTVVRNFNISVNNTGTAVMVLNTSMNSTWLNCTCGSGTPGLSFTYNNVSFLNFTGGVGSNATITVSFTVNGNTANGVYAGWIFFNATNSTAALSSHPYQSFNLTVQANVTNTLDVRLLSIGDPSGGNVISEGNGTGAAGFGIFKVKVFTINDSSEIIDLNSNNGTVPVGSTAANFTSVYLVNLNTSAPEGRIPMAGGYAVLTGNSPVYSGGQYNLNFSVPANTPGGLYNMVLTMSSVTSNQLNTTSTFVGGITNGTVYLNNSGMLLSTNDSSCSGGFGSSCSGSFSLATSATRDVVVNASNLGVLTQSGASANFTSSCSGYSVQALSSTGCGSPTLGSTGAATSMTLTGNTTSCLVTYRITAGSSAASACTSGVVGGPSAFSASPINFSITITNSSSSSSTTSSGGSGATTSSTTASSASYLDIPTYSSVVEIVQGKSGVATATVANTNNTLTQAVALSVINLNSTISYSVSPSVSTIAPGKTSDFTVTFNVPNATSIDSYSGSYQASSGFATATKVFSLHVLPGAAAKVQINGSLSTLQAQFTDLWNQINASRSAGANVTASEDIASQIAAKLAEAQAQIALGTDQGYFAANQLLNEVANLLNTGKAQLKVDQQNSGVGGFQWPINPLYIGIGVGIAAIGFLVYLFLPSKTSSGYRPRSSNNPVTDAANKISGMASGAKDATNDQFQNLKDKLKRAPKYKYEE